MASSIPLVSVDSTLGLALVGFAGSCVLYGVLCTQVYMYYKRFPYDRAAYRAIVVLIWLFETCDQAFIGHSVYYYNITKYGNPIAFLTERPVWSVILQILLGAVVGCIVKLAFSWRVWTFSDRNPFITGFIVALAIAQLALVSFFTGESFLSHSSLLNQLRELKDIGSYSLGIGVLTDIVIAVVLCYYLQRMRKNSSKVDSMARGLMRRALDTGILTSAFSLTTLIAYRWNPNNFTFLLFYFLLSKLYATTFLAALNTRTSPDEDKQSSPVVSGGGTTFMIGQESVWGVTDASTSGNLSMKMDIEAL